MRAAVLAALVAVATTAHAHGLRSAYLEVTESSPGRARLSLRADVPVTGVEPTTAAPCAIETTETGRWLACPETLVGATLGARGIGPIVSDVVIYVTLADGTTINACVTPRDPTWTIPGGAAPGLLQTARRYVLLGIVHIATGADHLLFLLALVLSVRRLRSVLLAETAFTLSHTLSFSASALGWVRVSPLAAEGCIAVSLVLVALDVGRAEPVPPRRAAGLAFAFGLVHGLGFAGGLAEIGVPAAAVPAALAGFAAGVELGQVAFLALVVAALALLAKRPRLDALAVRIGATAVGGVGCYWLFERLAALS